MDKSTIIKWFPLLASDPKFEVSSPVDNSYNCLAWAYQMFKDRWMWPPIDENGNPIPVVDGSPWWPSGVKTGLDIQYLVDAFLQKGFVETNTWEHEDGFVKVALYYDPATNHMTHAARESRNADYWMSKLGKSWDIHHGTPYTIEGKDYGKVYCIMKLQDI